MLVRILMVLGGLYLLWRSVLALYSGMILAGGGGEIYHYIHKATDPIRFWGVIIILGGCGLVLILAGINKDSDDAEEQKLDDS